MTGLEHLDQFRGRLRQRFSQVAASFDLDGVLAELDNERARLSELSAALQARRDRAVNFANVANLITGTGLGIAGNAMQFSNSTANIGNGFGVGSGVASSVLSIIAIRLRHGPRSSVGRIPNMLAPLFGGEPALNSYYPPAVLEYLHSVRRVKEKLVDRASTSSWLSGNRPGVRGHRALQRLITRSHFSLLAWAIQPSSRSTISRID